MRGGSRKGAGRKRLIEDEFSRLGIGGKCEELWQEEVDAAREKAWACQTKTVRVEFEKMKAIPASQRKKFFSGDGGKHHKEDVESALQTDQGLGDDEKPARYFPDFAGRRPKGKKKAIIEAVAKAESEERGIQISTRYVQTCWDDWRAIRADDLREQEEEEKQLDQDDNATDF